MKLPKNKEIKFPCCGRVALVNYRSKWRFDKRSKTKRCFDCSRMKKGTVNKGSYKKGLVPWNKGDEKAKNKLILKSRKEWKEWRKKIFERDDYTCQFCGIRGTELHPDHIKPYCLYPELVFELDNGRTLCAPCHRKTNTYGCRVRKFRTPQEYETFITQLEEERHIAQYIEEINKPYK